MRLLLVTQAVDIEDLHLGFFARWIEKLAPYFESIEVICLKEGTHTFPSNVRIYSLGKEKGSAPRFRYAYRFLMRAWSLRSEYDAVLVHMNQEYVLLAGLLWKLLGKKIYMWRNHYAGSRLTDLAASFCTNVFCTSRYSYTFKYVKTRLMPVGVDTERFHSDTRVAGKKHSILFFARMAPSKNPFMLLDALRGLAEKSIHFTATFAGSPLREHEAYYRSLIGCAERYGLSDRIAFLPGVPNHETPDLYRTHRIFVNCSPSGMFDKTLFEAAASGCLVLAASPDYRALAGESYTFNTSGELTERIMDIFRMNDGEQASSRTLLQGLAEHESLDILVKDLASELRP